MSRFLPDKEMRDTFRTDDTARLRFSDLPATSKLVRPRPCRKAPAVFGQLARAVLAF